MEQFIVGQILKDNLTFNDLYWKAEFKDKNKQLLFIFKGEYSKEIHSFAIPCAIKDSNDKILVLVKLIPYKNDDNKQPLAIDTLNADTINQQISNND